jgi:hypothetical protein
MIPKIGGSHPYGDHCAPAVLNALTFVQSMPLVLNFNVQEAFFIFFIIKHNVKLFNISSALLINH